MFRFIDFQKNHLIVTFHILFSVHYLEKVCADMSYSCTRGVPKRKVKIFGKVHFFQDYYHYQREKERDFEMKERL